MNKIILHWRCQARLCANVPSSIYWWNFTQMFLFDVSTVYRLDFLNWNPSSLFKQFAIQVCRIIFVNLTVKIWQEWEFLALCSQRTRCPITGQTFSFHILLIYIYLSCFTQFQFHLDFFLFILPPPSLLLLLLLFLFCCFSIIYLYIIFSNVFKWKILLLINVILSGWMCVCVSGSIC